MNPTAIQIILFNVNVVTLTYDQIEGYLLGVLLLAANWANQRGYISGTQEAAAMGLLAVWLHNFLRADTTGLVTKGVNLLGGLLGKFKHLTPAGVTPPAPPAAMLLLLAVMPLALTQHGCASLNNAAANVPASTVQNAARFVQQETADAVAAYVVHHPNALGDFQIAARSLNTFIAAGGTDPAALRAAIVADLPAADRADFSPLVDAAVGAYALYAADWVQKETAGVFAVDAKILLAALTNGLNAGLAPPPAN